jgi:hypothetical protein
VHTNSTPTLTLHLIERLMKEFKTHQAAVDFDAGFVQSFVSPAKEDLVLLVAKNEIPAAAGGQWDTILRRRPGDWKQFLSSTNFSEYGVYYKLLPHGETSHRQSIPGLVAETLLLFL